MDIFYGLATVLTSLDTLGFVALGVVVGVLVGAMPGMSIAAVIALMVPMTLYMSPIAALSFLYVLGKSGRYGGSIAAILFNTPGTAAAAATMNDGYPLTLQGRSKAALRMSTAASAIGDFIGDMLLIFGAAYIASFTEKFGPAEFFAIYMMAFIVIGSVVSDSVAKGLIAAVFGVLVSLVGTDPISGYDRLTFGWLELSSGFSLIPLLVGIFVIAELFDQVGKTYEPVVEGMGDGSDGGAITREEWRLSLPVIFRSSILGSIIGILPGLGSAVACFAAYGEEKRRAKRPELWGKGAIEGVAAPEAANNAVSGPSMIPLLALGIPGSTVAALLMGVFLIHGIQIGPTIFTTSRELVFQLFAAGLLGILGYFVLGYYLGPIFGKYITRLGNQYIYPFIFATALIAAYSSSMSFFDVYVMLAFGVIGYFMRRFGFPTSAFIIAFVLGRGAEESLRQAMLLSNDGILVFLDHPVAMVFILIGLAVLTSRIVSSLRHRAGRRAPVNS
ncbi:putative tricarboxylic transport membrane protein [Paracoccus halophilus]|uniref:Membrane protein n=1 Tax=Paracoccus halophilus TaxID=376733 RepID=A0A099F5R8_9RHOB|nr:tripartite tricarboxylate transporter permease [Paracoccus halophilus]KGJ05467.1 membrane protein [Paracoccus halophilus]SFA49387.1 putative tricarboxylic transport membrane protein [Paracoccus halophilus]